MIFRKEAIMGLLKRNKPEEKEYLDGQITEVEQKLIAALRLLYDAGILTNEEYREKKAKILEIN